MNRVVSANCPRCGAQLQPVPGSDQATCQYCGTTSFVQRAERMHAHAAPVPRKGNPARLLAALGFGTAVFLGIIVALVALARGPSERALPASSGTDGPAGETTAKASVVSAEPIQAPPVEILEDFRPLVADVDGDGTADVVAGIATTDADRSQHYAAFSGRDGHELSRTTAVADRNGAVTAVVGRRLISASRTGQLTCYGLANGSQQWTTALGARATAFCNAKNSEALIVATDERRQLAIDLTTGRQSETKEPCSAPITRADHNDDPRDRHDYDAPQGTESYHCGGVTVMGSQNYTVPDQCLVRARIDTDRLDGFIGHRLWKVDQNWLSFGIRNPGARVPMVALVARGKLAWKAALPLDNPLEAQEGSPRFAGLALNLIVLAYTAEKGQKPFVTAFSVGDGTRRWHVALPEGVKGVSSLATSPNRVFIRAGKQLILLDASNGQLVAKVGRER